MKINPNIPSFLFTFIFISFIFWNRLLRVRTPKDLTHFLDLNLSSTFIFILFLLFACITSYYYLRYLKIIPKENSKLGKIVEKVSVKLQKYSWYNALSLFFDTHIINGPKNTYEYLYERIYIRPLLNKLQTFTVYILDSHKEFIYLFIFVILRLIIPITFISEIIFYKQIKHFYMLLILLLIPLIIKFLLFFIEHNAIKNIESLEESFDFTYVPETDKIIINYKTLDKLEDTLLREKMDPYYLSDLWFFYQQVYNFVQQIYMLIDKEKYLINFMNYGLFSVGFFFYFLILIGWY